MGIYFTVPLNMYVNDLCSIWLLCITQTGRNIDLGGQDEPVVMLSCLCDITNIRNDLFCRLVLTLWTAECCETLKLDNI